MSNTTQVEVIPANAEPTAEPNAQQSNLPSIADHHANVVRLAENYHYQGELSVGALEDRIRFYQRRTVEDVLELGKCLLLLKEMCSRGEFGTRVELLGFSLRTAQKFMQATLKVKSEFNSLLKVVESQTKLLELIALDDIERMTATELKKALKQARAENEAKDEVLATKNRKIDELDAKLSVRKNIDNFKLVQEEVEQHINDELAKATGSLLTTVSHFNSVVDSLNEQASENFLPHIKEKIAQDITLAYNRLAQIGLSVGVDLAELMNPSWANVAIENVATDDDTE